MANRSVGKVAVRFKGYKFSDDTVYTFRYSNLGVVAKLGADTAPNFYAPYVHDAIILEEEFDKDHSNLSINLANDSSLDDLLEYNFRGYEIEVHLSSNEYPNEHKYYLMYTGSIDTLLVNEKKITIKCTSNFDVFDTPLNPSKFSGTGSYDGDAELTDKTKPRVIGKVFNIKPAVIDSANHIYGCNWDVDGDFASVEAISDVRDGGADVPIDTTLGTSGDFTTTALMDAATPAAGKYISCIADGTIKLETRPTYDLTMDVNEGTDTYTEWLTLLASELGLAGKTVISTYTYTIGAYFESATDYTKADAILRENLDIYNWFTADGYLNSAKVRDDGAVTPTVHFIEAGMPLTTPDDMVYFSSIRNSYELPYKDITMNYKKNYTIQGTGSIAGSVSQANEELYGRESTPINETNVCTTDPYLLDKVIEYNSPLYDSTEASTEVTAWKDEREFLTDYITVTCPLLAYNSDIISGVLVESSGVNLTIADEKVVVTHGISDEKDEVPFGISDNNSSYVPQVSLSVGLISTMSHSRFDYSNHRFIIIGIKINTRKMTIEYKLKGFRKDSECT